MNYGIVEQGELTIIGLDGKEKVVHEGEAVVEMVGTVHHGENRGTVPVILNMFYISQKDMPLAVQHPEIPLEELIPVHLMGIVALPLGNNLLHHSIRLLVEVDGGELARCRVEFQGIPRVYRLVILVSAHLGERRDGQQQGQNDDDKPVHIFSPNKIRARRSGCSIIPVSIGNKQEKE